MLLISIYDINNETIREVTGVKKIKKLLREHRLQKFGHIKRMDERRAPVKAKNFAVNGSKRGRPKKRQKEAVEKDMPARCDRAVWRLGCQNRPTPACR